MLPGAVGKLDANGIPKEYKSPHQAGINAENRVSGTKRDENTQIYKDSKGNKVQVQITQLPNGGIQVTKTIIK